MNRNESPSDEKRRLRRQNDKVRAAKTAMPTTEEPPAETNADLVASAAPAPEGTPQSADDMVLFPGDGMPKATPEEDETAVSPQEQAQYSQVVNQFARTLYAPGRTQEFVKAMANPNVPIHEQVGRIVANMGQAVESKAEAAGDKLTPDVMFHAGNEVVGMLLELASRAGVVKLDPESDQYQKVHALSMMEAEKAWGERILADPKKAPIAVDEAGNAWAQGIGEEVDNGSADPEFVKATQGIISQRTGEPGSVKEGVNMALRGGSGQP